MSPASRRIDLLEATFDHDGLVANQCRTDRHSDTHVVTEYRDAGRHVGQDWVSTTRSQGPDGWSLRCSLVAPTSTMLMFCVSGRPSGCCRSV